MPEDAKNVNASSEETLMTGKYIVLIETKTRRDWVKLCLNAKLEYFVLCGDWAGGELWSFYEYPCKTEGEANKTFKKFAAQAFKYRKSRGNLSFVDYLKYEAWNGAKSGTI